MGVPVTLCVHEKITLKTWNKLEGKRSYIHGGRRLVLIRVSFVHAMKTQRGNEGIAPLSLNLWVIWIWTGHHILASFASLRGRNLGTRWRRGSVNPRTGLDVLRDNKTFFVDRDSNEIGQGLVLVAVDSVLFWSTFSYFHGSSDIMCFDPFYCYITSSLTW
jgi:hypothetical protein